VFFRLVCGAHFVIAVGQVHLLDVGAEDVGDDFAVGEIDQMLGAFDEGGPISYVEPAGVEVIASEEHAGFAVIKGEGGGLVAGDGEDVNEAVAEIDGSDIVVP
jgi:hypothetical protein